MDIKVQPRARATQDDIIMTTFELGARSESAGGAD